MNSNVQSIKALFRHPDLGLLIIRAAVGFVLMFAGYNKFMGGEQVLHSIGLSINYLGMDVVPNSLATIIFGVLAAGVELVGGLALVVGAVFRTSAAFLFITMLVATLMKIDTSGGNFNEFGYPMVMGLVLVGLLFTGAGRVSLQKE